MSTFGARIVPLALTLSLVGMAAAHAGRGKGKNKKKSHRYHGAHPLSVKPESGFCYIEVPHVHPHTIHKTHKPLYREHEGNLVFVADPVSYGYDGEQHSYYGHHPVAVDVVLGDERAYASGQQLEFCYLDGPHYHHYEAQPGLTFETTAGASWYIGEFPEAYVEGRAEFSPVNRVYAKIEVQRPEVVFEAPPHGYVGPVLDVHLHVPAAVVIQPGHVDVGVGGHGHGHGHGNGHAEVRAGVEVHIPTPTLQIGIGIGVDGHHGHKGKRHKGKSHKGKSHKGKGHKGKRKGRSSINW